MSRGTPWGETPVSKANTDAFDSGYDRIFGADRKPQRGRWFVNPNTGELCETNEAWRGTDSETVPVVTDRYMEGVRAMDGTDIGSRAKRNAYMKANGLVDADDYKGVWARGDAQKAREAQEKRALHESLKHTLHQLNQKRR